MTSFHEQADSLAELHALLLTHADAGHCLLAGQLTVPLSDESRAGKSKRGEPHAFVIFDFDKVEAGSHEEAVKKYLPAECQGVSYIAQPSSSMYVPGAKRWAGHVFMLLDKPVLAEALRTWIETINFKNQGLHDQLRLADSGHSLRWPLDRSSNYDSRLIYIAQPRTYGFKPAIDAKASMVLVKKRRPSVRPDLSVTLSRHEVDAKINELRRAIGLPDADLRTRPFEDGEVLLSVDPGVISDVRAVSGHYLQFNMNGGDSRGYWIDLHSPEVIRNFKGEPWVLTEDIDEKFYHSLKAVSKTAISKPALDDGAVVLAFYATNQNSRVKIGTYEPVKYKLELNPSTETAARAWLAKYGVVRTSYLPHMSVVFDPTTEIQYLDGATQVNTFSPTAYMRQEPDRALPVATLKDVPRLADKIMRSMLGDPSDDIYSHFLHWLAYILRTRKKSEIGWVITGRTGTGKGVFVKYILRPLFGNEMVQNVQFTALADQFNGYLENSLIVVFEECDTNMSKNPAELEAKLKHYVTDSPIQIRRMTTDHYAAPNYTNFLFFANERTPVVVRKDNRRYVITERQEHQLHLTPNEMVALNNGVELEALADVLLRWPLDEIALRTIHDTAAARDMHEATTPLGQQLADAIKAGDLQFFVDRMPSDMEAAAEFYNRFNPIGLYRAKIDSYLTAAANRQPVLVYEEDMYILFRTLLPDPNWFKDSKIWRRRYFKSLGLDVDKRQRIPGDWSKQARGIMVTWTMPEGVEAPSTDEKVVKLRKPAKKGATDATAPPQSNKRPSNR